MARAAQAGGARVESPDGAPVPVAYLYWFSLNALLDRYERRPRG